MKMKTAMVLAGVALCMQSAQATVIVSNTFAAGNGSFEFDSGGVQLVGGTVAAPAEPGLWVNSGTNTLTIDGTDTIVGVNDVQAITDAGASDGTHALYVRSGPYANGGSFGGFLNTGYVVGESDVFTLNFDWTITNNQLGATIFEVYLFTSSDDTLSGTLTSLGSRKINYGPAVSGFQSVTLNDLAAGAANVGKKLWVSVTPDGFSGNGLNEIAVVDNISITQKTVPPDVVVNNLFGRGNGSIEFDSDGIQLVGSPATPGLWVNSGTNASLTMDGIDSIVGVNFVRAITDAGASDGTHALHVRSGAYGAGGSYGGFLNTGYAVGAADEFTLSFDWTITNNKLGAMNFEVYLFTSSDDTLSGTLTSLGSKRISQGGAVTGFQTVTLTNLAPVAANVGQQLWVSVTPDGFTSSGLSEIAVVDNINVLQTTVYVTPANLTIDYNTGQLSVTATEIAFGATNILQGTMDLVLPNWVDLSTTTGVEEVTWPISELETNRFFRVESN